MQNSNKNYVKRYFNPCWANVPFLYLLKLTKKKLERENWRKHNNVAGSLVAGLRSIVFLSKQTDNLKDSFKSKDHFNSFFPQNGISWIIKPKFIKHKGDVFYVDLCFKISFFFIHKFKWTLRTKSFNDYLTGDGLHHKKNKL